MNKILCLLTLSLTIFYQGTSNVSASEVEMSDDDFTRFVCGYLHRIDNKTVALDEIKAATASNSNPNQLAILAQIENSDSATEDLCSSYLPRF